MATVEREIIRTSRPDIQYLKECAEGVAQGEFSARHVARMAVYAGMLLVGGTVPKATHYPVVVSEHHYIDLRDENKVKQIPETMGHAKMLHASKNTDVAIMAALFGNMNSRRERAQRCAPFTGHSVANFGWGIDQHKTEAAYASGDIFDDEGGMVHTHARPELINAAVAKVPLTGFVDCVYDDESFQHIGYDVGQYIGPKPRRTIVRIPISSHLDLPLDIIPTNYDDMDEINL